MYRTTLENLSTASSSVSVTLYEHTPSFGLIYTKEPSGEKNYYNYDLYGRLTNICKESNSGTIQQVEYHATQQLSALTVNHSYYFASTNPKILNVSFSINGGSGNYTYSSIICNSSGTTVKENNNTSFSHTFTETGTYTMTITVTDQITQETVVKTETLSIIDQQTVEFSNIQQHVRESYGNYYSTATIVCEQATTAKFSISASAENGSYSCTIGSYTYDSSAGEKFSVSLAKGTNNVKIRLTNAPTGNIDLILDEVTGGTVGSNSYLTVSAEKAEN